jgi:hypothetical protein
MIEQRLLSARSGPSATKSHSVQLWIATKSLCASNLDLDVTRKTSWPCSSTNKFHDVALKKSQLQIIGHNSGEAAFGTFDSVRLAQPGCRRRYKL